MRKSCVALIFTLVISTVASSAAAHTRETLFPQEAEKEEPSLPKVHTDMSIWRVEVIREQRRTTHITYITKDGAERCVVIRQNKRPRIGEMVGRLVDRKPVFFSDCPQELWKQWRDE